jgi:hypothetical protein
MRTLHRGSTRRGSLGSQSAFTIKLNFRKASAGLLKYILRPDTQRRTISRSRLHHFREKSRARGYVGAEHSRMCISGWPVAI